jgi:hypothetical protein
MANLFTQRSLERNESLESVELFSKKSTRDWRLETNIVSASEHGLLKVSAGRDFFEASEYINAALAQVAALKVLFPGINFSLAPSLISTLFLLPSFRATMLFMESTTAFFVLLPGMRNCNRQTIQPLPLVECLLFWH